jgi:hypothetical protein
MQVFEERWELPLVAANTGGIALVSGWPVPALIGFSVWLADFAWRLFRQTSLADET